MRSTQYTEFWTSQPQESVEVDRASPLIVGDTSIILGSNYQKDPGTQRLYTVSSGITKKASMYGLSPYGRGGSAVYLPSIVDNAVPYTIAAISRGMFTLEAKQYIASGVVWSGGFKAQAQVWDTTIPGIRTIQSSVSGTEWLRIVITMSINNVMSLYVNDVLIGTETIGGFASDSRSRFCLTYQDGTVYGEVPIALKTNKCWSRDEVIAWGRNPWQVFEPQTSHVYLPSAGGGIYSLSDSGSGSDAISISVAFGLSDTGAGNDLQPSPGAALTLLDDGASADAVSLAALLAVTDTGAGSDADTVSVAFALADSGSGADAILVLTQLLMSVSDAAYGVDGVSIQAQIALADSGSGADTPVLYVSLSVADSASAADTLDVLQQLLISVADTGAGLDGMAIAINVPVGDAGSGMDVPSIQAWLALVESATGMDASVVFNAGGQRIATILFKLAHRAMTFTLAARQISFTLN